MPGEEKIVIQRADGTREIYGLDGGDSANNEDHLVEPTQDEFANNHDHLEEPTRRRNEPTIAERAEQAGEVIELTQEVASAAQAVREGRELTQKERRALEFAARQAGVEDEDLNDLSELGTLATNAQNGEVSAATFTGAADIAERASERESMKKRLHKGLLTMAQTAEKFDGIQQIKASWAELSAADQLDELRNNLGLFSDLKGGVTSAITGPLAPFRVGYKYGKSKLYRLTYKDLKADELLNLALLGVLECKPGVIELIENEYAEYIADVIAVSNVAIPVGGYFGGFPGVLAGIVNMGMRGKRIIVKALPRVRADLAKSRGSNESVFDGKLVSDKPENLGSGDVGSTRRNTRQQIRGTQSA